MATYVMATNAVTVSEQLSDYLENEVDAEDTVYAINSQERGTDTMVKRRGEEALEVVEERLGGLTAVETRQ